MKKLLMTVALGLMAATSFGAELTYEQFLESCQNPDAFGHQRPPENIKVICADERTRWVPVESAPFELDTTAVLSSELFSDKHHVALETYPQPGSEANGVCPRLREDLTSAVVEFSLTCSQALNNKAGDLEDLCQDAIATAEAANPDIRESEPTGRFYEPCDESAPQQQQQQEQQQQQGGF